MSTFPSRIRDACSDCDRVREGPAARGLWGPSSAEAAATDYPSRDVRRARGVYYTPIPVVRYIVQQTLCRLSVFDQPAVSRPLRVLDPACGGGVFLQEAYRYLLKRRRDQYVEQVLQHSSDDSQRKLERTPSGRWRLTTAERVRILQRHLFGVDVDAQAVAQTKRRLAGIALRASGSRSVGATRPEEIMQLAAALDANVRCGNALIDCDFLGSDPLRRDGASEVRPFAWDAEFAEVFPGPGGGFDAVVANPPYVNIRLLTKTHGPEVKDYLREKYRCAYRGYDTYVLFFERAYDLLRPNGLCGVIAPNKIATLDYALPCRELLVKRTTIRHIADVSALNLFPGAGVYPYIFVWQKKDPEHSHTIAVLHARSLDDLARRRITLRIRQRELSAVQGLRVHGTLDVESRVATAPLGRRAQLHSGATGFSARRLAGDLRERGRLRSQNYFEFIVSGNIDRYQIRVGDVRFMKRLYTRPVLPANAKALSAGKRELYGQRKIVIAGIARRLEAAWDQDGLALGVQVYAAAETADDPHYLLALLNSKLLSHLFRIRYQAKRLGGGFLAVNKGQLARLPIRTIEKENQEGRTLQARLAQLAAHMQQLNRRWIAAKSAQLAARLTRRIRAADRSIDRLVYQLYDLTEKEIAEVEASVGGQ